MITVQGQDGHLVGRDIFTIIVGVNINLFRTVETNVLIE